LILVIVVAKKNTTHVEFVKIGEKLKEVVTFLDNAGKPLYKHISPLMLEFKFRDIVQVIVGASILAIPVGFTEETWVLGANLPLWNIFGFFLLSLFFISCFVYYNYYMNHIKTYYFDFFKRVFATYFLSFLVVSIVLILIQKAPWSIDPLLALKRVVLVTFPASMSAAVADMVK
jgi:uncharacterized membrane protein